MVGRAAKIRLSITNAERDLARAKAKKWPKGKRDPKRAILIARLEKKIRDKKAELKDFKARGSQASRSYNKRTREEGGAALERVLLVAISAACA